MVNHVNRDYAHSEEVSSGKHVMELNDDATKSDMEDKDVSDDSVNFVTSTPVKRKFNCEECANQSQCVDCFVRQENPSNIQFSP